MQMQTEISLIVKERGAAMPRIDAKWPMVVLQASHESPLAFSARVLLSIDAFERAEQKKHTESCGPAISGFANVWLVCNRQTDEATFAGRLAIAERLARMSSPAEITFLYAGVVPAPRVAAPNAAKLADTLRALQRPMLHKAYGSTHAPWVLAAAEPIAEQPQRAANEHDDDPISHVRPAAHAVHSRPSEWLSAGVS